MKEIHMKTTRIMAAAGADRGKGKPLLVPVK
jgi:hypothetical protein